MAVELKSIAIRQAAKALLATQLDIGTVISVSIEPTYDDLGRVEVDFTDQILTANHIRDRLIVCLAEIPAGELLGVSTSLAAARLNVDWLLYEVAVRQNPNWRQTDPSLTDRILKKALVAAKKLVRENETKIWALADALMVKVTLAGEELTTLLN